MSSSSFCSSSGLSRSSEASMEISRWNRSRWLATLTYSPAAMLKAPASRPARPANRTVLLFVDAPAKPMTSAVLDTRPSLTPNTAARVEPDLSPRCQGSPGVGVMTRCPCAAGAGTAPVSSDGPHLLEDLDVLPLVLGHRRRGPPARRRTCPRRRPPPPRGGAVRRRIPHRGPAPRGRRRSGRARWAPAGTGTPYSVSFSIQCSACSSSICASSSSASRRSPSTVSASAR